jgi:RNA polymerase sigma-70 factor (ECF subfamily)
MLAFAPSHRADTPPGPISAREGVLSPPAFGYHVADQMTNATPDTLPRIAAGEPGAVEECLDRYGGLVWSIARRFSSSTSDAEDAVQDVFIDLWQKAGRFDASKGSEKTFIAMIARRRLIDRLRRSSRRPEVELPDEDWALPSSDADSRIERSAEASLASRYLAELKPEQQQALYLSLHLGYTHREIAEKTGMPIGTVKSHIFRGLADVRERLESGDVS